MLKRIRNTLSNFNSKISSLVEKHQLFSVSKNNIKHYLLAVLILAIVIITISSSLAATVPVKSIEIKSENLNYDNKEQGAWKVTKSAYWTAKNKARITFDVDTIEKIPDKNRRIILVLDCSEAMNNVNFQRIKQNISEVMTALSKDKKTNTLAYVEFNDTASTKVEFTTSTYTIEKEVKEATASGGSSYYSALQQVDSLLKNYTKVDTENVSVIFITSGSPNVDTPNEVSQYTYLKEQYPYLEIKAIQYELGDESLESVKNISDKQYAVSSEIFKRTFNSVVFGVMEYDDFSITDKINSNYFNIESVSTEDGEALLINGDSVNWNITNSRFTTGTKKQLNIDVTINDTAKVNVTDLCDTNTEETIVSKLDDISENITSTLTPILSAGYTVTYDINSPPECTPSYIPSAEKYFVFDSVNFPTEVPTCFGYQFKNWEIMTNNVTSTNNNEFIMPEENVTVKALWTKLSLNKSNTGKVTEQATLYNVIKNEAVSSSGLAKEYVGNHQDSISTNGNRKIYYYYAENDSQAEQISYYKNNVIFAGMCWQMIRTTDTGGVKMIYNGVPGTDNACYLEKETIGYLSTTISLGLDEDEYYYGTSYEYDSSTKTFKISGTISHATLTSDNYKDLINKYTCLGTRKEDTCSYIIYTTDMFATTTTALPIIEILAPINSNDIGNVTYNFAINDIFSSVQTAVGYMYNTAYGTTSNIIKVSEKLLTERTFSTGVYYANSYSTANDHYRLRLPTKADSGDDASAYKGKYTLYNQLILGTGVRMFYIADTYSNYTYAIELTYPNDLDYYNYSYSYGDDYIENEDGTYTINNATTFKRVNWLEHFSAVKGKYICKLNDNNKCDVVHYATTTSRRDYNGLAVAGVTKHASSYTYENGVYKLSDDATTKWDIIGSDTTNIDNSHYVCTDEINENNECKELAYVYYFDGKVIYAIQLNDGKNIETVLQEMLYADDINQKSSTAKVAIEAWYEKNMNNYASYLEDTIFCNNRTITNLAGWNSKEGKIKSPLTFKEYNPSGDLSCQNITDKFSVNNNKAKLEYPVGLLTGEEISLLNNTKIIQTTNSYYLLSPMSVTSKANISLVDMNYKQIETPANPGLSTGYALRPVISLKPNTKYISGDGSIINPYVVDMSE